MALTITVLQHPVPLPDATARRPSLTVDAPRVVLGRGDGCEVRLPDVSVSHRHASLRQRGGDWVIVDEGSQNGTFVDKVRLPPQTPHLLRSGDAVRLGRVWIEILIHPMAAAARSPAAAAKALALELVAHGLLAEGEVPWPRVTVVEGPDKGAALVIGSPGRSYTIGRSRECDFVLTDPQAGRRHAMLVVQGDAIGVTDLGSSRETLLDGAALGTSEVLWRPGQELEIAATRLHLSHPAADALAEIERSPEERMREDEIVERPVPRDAPPPTTSETPTPAETEVAPAPATRLATATPREPTRPTWRALDGLVVLVALGVLALSVAAAFWVFAR